MASFHGNIMRLSADGNRRCLERKREIVDGEVPVSETISIIVCPKDIKISTDFPGTIQGDICRHIERAFLAGERVQLLPCSRCTSKTVVDPQARYLFRAARLCETLIIGQND